MADIFISKNLEECIDIYNKYMDMIGALPELEVAWAADVDGSAEEEQFIGSEEDCVEFIKSYVINHKDRIESIGAGIHYVDEDDTAILEALADDRIFNIHDDFDLGDWAVWINEASFSDEGLVDISGNSDYAIDELQALYRRLGCPILQDQE